jgi:hypothetical protein
VVKNSAYPHDLDRHVPVLTPPRRAKRAREIFSAKIQCNPLKRLDSDERIQGNPSFSNRHEPRAALVAGVDP